LYPTARRVPPSGGGANGAVRSYSLIGKTTSGGASTFVSDLPA
jgi:hypothetical protein